MERVNITDIETILAYVTDRNTQCALELNNLIMARIKELIGDSPDFPTIGVMLTNDQTVMVGHDPDKPVIDGTVFVYIVDVGPDNKATGVNTFWIIDLNTGVIEDRSTNIVTLQ